MKGRCFLMRRRFLPYLEGKVSDRQAGRVERHLAHCVECAGLLARLRAGHRAARQYAASGPEPSVGSPPEFAEIWVRFEAREGDGGGRFLVRRSGSPFLAARTVVVVGLVMAAAALLVLSSRGPRLRRDAGAALGGFVPVSIADFDRNTQAPVVTEGVIGAVYFDEEEQTLHIKLLDPRHKPEPFVICEVRRTGSLDVPPEGSRVRIYGTPRFDGQPGRGWHEVNPVVGIDLLKK